MKPKNILLVYVNLPMEMLFPIGISSLATVLEDKGYNVKIFDTTLYPVLSNLNDQNTREDGKQIKPVDYDSVRLKIKTTDIYNDFKKVLNDFKPDLVGFSCTEHTFELAEKLVKLVDSEIPTVTGGCFATFANDLYIGDFDAFCIGEGENSILTLVEDFELTENIAYKYQHRELADINKLPIPRFNLFEPKRIYRPMDGKLYRMIPIEISRGCPYKCTYCSAPMYAKMFKGWLRYKTVDRIMEEIKYYITNYDVEYFYFISETFLAMSKRERDKFYDLYKEYKIPFWFNTRPETVNEYDIKRLKEVGCHRISIGIESGNAEYRRKYLKRNYTNIQVLEACEKIKDNGIQLSVNNMIGFPDETEKMIIETIHLNMDIEADSHTVNIYQPYKGTELYEYCIKKGYWSKDKICNESFDQSVLDQDCIAKEKINYYYKNFNNILEK